MAIKDTTDIVGSAVEAAVRSVLSEKNKPSKEVLKIAVDEQRRFHDELTGAFREVRSKILYLIAATFTFLTFLYASAAENSTNVKLSIRQRLFIPSELYGIVFYFIGLACILYALAKLVQGARPNAKWVVPFELSDYSSLSQTDERKYLLDLKNEYVNKTEANLKTHSEKNSSIRDSFYPLIVGAIILIVLRYFQ